MNETPEEKLLIVDDEMHVRDILSRWLTAEGHCCEMASNAEEALEHLGSGRFAVLISDIKMPGTSGLELLAKAKENYPDVAVIMVTAVDARETAIRALQLGAYGYVIKPFDQNEIVIAVTNAMERRRLEGLRAKYERQLENEVRARTAAIRNREEQITLRLLSAAEYRDDETGAHIRRIGQYSEIMAEELGMKPQEVANIRLAAPMHDVGKIGIPDSILRKPGPLNREERLVMQQHTTIGAQILGESGVRLLEVASEIALSHHEKWDGSGYPRGLSERDIPLTGRIVALADVYDALVNDRVYRPAMPEEKALAIMEDGKEAHFDPDLFDLFLKLLPEFRRIRQETPKDADISVAFSTMA